MSLDDLTPGQLRQLELIRQRRRELTAEATRDHRDLLGIVNAAGTRRSEKRHRFMLLAGGIVGVAAPLLLQRTPNIDPTFIRLGSAFLLAHIIIGAVFDAIDDRRSTPVLVKVGKAVRMAAALALAEDAKLIALAAGNADPELDRGVDAARQQAEDADGEFRQAADDFANVGGLESALFFGAFVLGVATLLFAVGSAS